MQGFLMPPTDCTVAVPCTGVCSTRLIPQIAGVDARLVRWTRTVGLGLMGADERRFLRAASSVSAPSVARAASPLLPRRHSAPAAPGGSSAPVVQRNWLLKLEQELFDEDSASEDDTGYTPVHEQPPRSVCWQQAEPPTVTDEEVRSFLLFRSRALTATAVTDCAICLGTEGADAIAHTLACGHTFCRSCIQACAEARLLSNQVRSRVAARIHAET